MWATRPRVLLPGFGTTTRSLHPPPLPGNQLANEALKAAAHFGNTTAESNRYAQYVILSPPGTDPDGFNTNSGNFVPGTITTLTRHLSGGAAPSIYGDIAFTNMPYVTDAVAAAGQLRQ